MKNTLVKVSLALALACSLPAQAVVTNPDGSLKKCTISDSWRGPDKTKHAIGGAAIGSSVTAYTKDPVDGVLATAVVAGLKEAVDRRGYGTCSFQDFAVTVAAGAVGAYTTNWLIVPENKGISVFYTKQFK